MYFNNICYFLFLPFFSFHSFLIHSSLLYQSLFIILFLHIYLSSSFSFSPSSLVFLLYLYLSFLLLFFHTFSSIIKVVFSFSIIPYISFYVFFCSFLLLPSLLLVLMCSSSDYHGCLLYDHYLSKFLTIFRNLLKQLPGARIFFRGSQEPVKKGTGFPTLVNEVFLLLMINDFFSAHLNKTIG